jgi:hypothetical protein
MAEEKPVSYMLMLSFHEENLGRRAITFSKIGRLIATDF